MREYQLPEPSVSIKKVRNNRKYKLKIILARFFFIPKILYANLSPKIIDNTKTIPAIGTPTIYNQENGPTGTNNPRMRIGSLRVTNETEAMDVSVEIKYMIVNKIQKNQKLIYHLNGKIFIPKVYQVRTQNTSLLSCISNINYRWVKEHQLF